MKDDSQCFEKIKCPDCGSSKGLQTYYNHEKDTYTGFCFSGCSEFKTNPYGESKPTAPKKKTEEDILQEIQEIKSLKSPPTSIRKIEPNYFKKFGVRFAVSEFDGKTPQAIYYPYTTKGSLTGWKGRNLMKKAFYSIGDLKAKVDPFGFVRALKVGAKRVYVCCGENDAIALDMILTMGNAGTKYSKTQYSIVSVPKGEGTIIPTLKALSRFDEIVVIPDQDEAGEILLKKAIQYTDVLYINPPPSYNDVHSVLESGKEDIILQWANNIKWNASKPKTAGIITIAEILKRGVEKPKEGLSYPWEGLTELTLGQRFGEAMAIGAGVGLGKTLLAHEIAAHNFKVHGEKTFMVLLEEDNIDTLRNVAGKLDNIPYHRPDADYDEQQLIDTATSFSEDILLWDDTGTTVDRFDMDEILKAIRFNTLELGVRFHVIDNMTCLSPPDPSGANEFINEYAKIIANMVVELDIHIDVYSHLNPVAKGVPHESGGKVLESQFTGSRAMMRSFPVMVGFRRNKHAEGSFKHNSVIEVLKNRKYGDTGYLKTQFNHSTGRLLENSWEGDLIKGK